MTKATITGRSGAKVTIEGTPDEVAVLVARFEAGEMGEDAQPRGEARRKGAKQRATPMSLILDLIGEGYFRTPQGLGAVRLALEERGHFYPVTTLSPVMLRLVKKKHLRRLKQGKLWVYVE